MSAASLFDARLPPRYWSKVSPEPNSGCWLWTAAASRNGYGIFGRGTRKMGLVASHMRKFATHCKRGHEFTARNTGRHTNGGRYCVECSRQRAREAYQARKTAA